MYKLRSLLLGIAIILIVGIGGLVYRNALEHPAVPIACPLDAKMCPDGTGVGRVAPACTFTLCPPPNVTLSEVGISYAIPLGFTVVASPDALTLASYQQSTASSSSENANTITIRRFTKTASSTTQSIIAQTAIGGASGAPVGPSLFTHVKLGKQTFVMVPIERFEGVVDVAYYLDQDHDVLRFDAIDQGVDWTNPKLSLTTLPAQSALRHMLETLQVD